MIDLTNLMKWRTFVFPDERYNKAKLTIMIFKWA